MRARRQVFLILALLVAITEVEWLCVARATPSLFHGAQGHFVISSSSKTYLSKAAASQAAGDYPTEIDNLNAAIKLDPKVAELFERRADAYYRLGQLENAVADANAATRLSNGFSDADWTAAAAYEELGKYSEALDLRTRIIKAEGRDAFAWFGRANDYEALGKFNLALSDWQKSFNLADPNNRAKMQLWRPLIDFSAFPSQSPRGLIRSQLRSSVDLPFHYDTGGHICVPLEVNGHAFQFILDTGSANSDLWKDATVGVATLEKVKVPGTNAGGRVHLYSWFRARQVKLGNLMIPNVAMESDTGLSEHSTLSGFLGGNLLENFVVTIDYAKKRVILSDSLEPFRLKQAILMPMTLRDHRPHCKVTLNGKLTVVATLDTGSSANLAAASLIKPVLRNDITYREHTSGPWLGDLSIAPTQFKNLRLGAATVDAPIIDVFPSKEAPGAAGAVTLGNCFFSGFKAVTFDYPARRLILEPNEKPSKSAEQWYCEGRFYLSHHQEHRAIVAFSRSMILEHELAERCYHYRAEAFVRLKEYEQALRDFDTLIRLNSSDSWTYYHRAWAYGRLGEWNHQIADDTRAIELQPNFESAYRDRAEAYFELGMQKLAAADLKMADEISRHR
jgi:tetratricopeptide (TPR) repeat protein